MKHILLAGCIVLATALAQSQPSFSEENATKLIHTLAVEIGPRPMGSPAEQQALNFAARKFREAGCETSWVMPMVRTERSNTTSGIAIGVRKGATGRIILIGGHIDSAGPEIPGADDDGSGSATVMELARTLCQTPHQSTLVFCCWGGEERGLLGSKYFVDHYDQLDSVALMLQIDMANGTGLIELDPDCHAGSAPSWLVRALVEEFNKLGYKGLRYPTHFFSLNYAGRAGSGSDHESFIEKGIPAVDLSTDVGKPIHTPRDNFMNLDPKGMARTGNVMQKLVERFDSGVPSRTTERYWLLLAFGIPLFLPLPGVIVFALIALAVSVIAFVAVRKRREPPETPGRARWSALKLWLMTMLIVASGWISPDLVSLVTGVRYPWMTSIAAYMLLAAAAVGIGAWLAVRWTKALRVTRCPYALFKRAAIVLWIYFIPLGLLNVKLLMEISAGLLLVSLAILVRPWPWRLVFSILAPVWPLRLLLSEWFPLLARTIALSMPGGAGPWLLLNGGLVLACSFALFPFILAFAAVIRDAPPVARAVRLARSRTVLVALLLAFLVMGGTLATRPAYDELWYKNVNATQMRDMNKGGLTMSVTGGEFLDQLRIREGSLDTTLTGRTTSAVIPVTVPYDSTWCSIDRSDSVVLQGDSVSHRIELKLHAAMRPYVVSISYTSGPGPIGEFSSPFASWEDRNGRRMEWYSFPDTALTVPVEFTASAGDSVRERVEVSFAQLAAPATFSREQTYVIPRTVYSQTHTYRQR